MRGQDFDRFAVLPTLYAELLAKPLRPLIRGTLPQTDAVYILYRDQEPLTVGSPPDLDEMRWLAPSFRGDFNITLSRTPPPPMRAKAMPQRHQTASQIEARWSDCPDKMMRIAFEIYISQKLGIEPSAPNVRELLGWSQPN